MAAPTLEKARGCHEEIELIEKAIVRSLTEDPKNHKDSIHRSHYVNSLLNLSLQKHKELVAVYEDKDGALERDMNDLSGNGLDVFSNLNDRVNEIKKYYSQFHVQLEPTEEFVVFPEEIRFSGEEGYGRYLDLHEHYEAFLNLSFVKANAFAQLDYFSFLSSFFKFDVFPSLPHDKPYRAYLDNLLNYLIDFIQRSQPLYELEETLRQTDEEFAALYASGFRSWSSPSSTSSSADAPQEVSDAITTSDPKQTSSNPLFCAACNKTFSKQTVFDAHLKAAKHLKAFQQMEAQQKDFLFVEFKINKLGQVLADKISDTKINIEKKQARTYDVIEGDLEDDEDYEESDEEEEEEDNEENRMRIQNYPVGWDGKPIPYWLYKLHGLGTEFKCEICGNTSFWGRRAFERHFQEPRHNQGMKAIGVPNTKHFHEITRVKDALELWKKIQKDREREEWNQEQGEEFEDSEGNVISKKIFSDLKRQGLLKF